MKNKFTFFTSRLSVGTVFLGIFISIFCSLFIFQFSFSESYILDGLSNSTPTTIRQNSDFSNVINNVIGTALSLIAVVFFVLVVYGGFLYMTASGNEDQAKKGRDVVIASAIGVVIIMSSYALIQFIFSAVEGGSSGPEKINTCEEYNPNWDCMDITKCAGATNEKNLTDAEIDCEEGNINNCVRNKCMAGGLDEVKNTVCCLPYKSLCEINNPGYECVKDAEECTSAAVTPPTGLCTDTNDGGTFCCESRVVWSYDSDGTDWSDKLGKEGQISDKEGEGFVCVSTTGKFSEAHADVLGGSGNNIWNDVIQTLDLSKSSLGKYQFNSEEECQLYGETEKVFCLKYDKDAGTNKGFYCAELLLGDSTRDCAEVSSRLFGGLESNDLDVPCIYSKNFYNEVSE